MLKKVSLTWNMNDAEFCDVQWSQIPSLSDWKIKNKKPTRMFSVHHRSKNSTELKEFPTKTTDNKTVHCVIDKNILMVRKNKWTWKKECWRIKFLDRFSNVSSWNGFFWNENFFSPKICKWKFSLFSRAFPNQMNTFMKLNVETLHNFCVSHFFQRLSLILRE